MKLHQKYILAILPIILMGFGALGYWAFKHSRDALFANEYEVMVRLLDDAIVQIIDRRYVLLEEAGLAGVPSFVEQYKNEALADLQILGEKSNRRLFVFDRGGDAIFCSDCESLADLDGWADLATRIVGHNKGSYTPPNGETAIFDAHAYTRPNWDWAIFVTRPVSTISAQVGEISLVALLVSLASMFAVSAILIWITRRLLLTPVEKLQQAASEIARHHRATRIDVYSNDELGQLARDMESMSRSIFQSVEAAQAANRAKSNFLSTMSHEIRTPLNGVLGLTQLLAASDLNADQRAKVETILSSGQTLLAIISDVLDISRIESGRIEFENIPFRVSEVVSVVSSPFQSLAEEKGLAMNVDNDTDPNLVVRGDPVRLRQILWNLLSNAIKFTDSGSVALSISEATAADGAISRTGPRVLKFVVRDTGVGIAPDRIDAIFEAFTQADNSISRMFGGTGLGLTIVRQLLERMTSDIRATSEPGKGTTFEFSIPFERVEEGDAQPDPNIFGAYDLSSLKCLNVLIAEDNEVNALILRSFLDKAGHNARVVKDGVQAVEAMRENWADLVLMDVHMPRKNGAEATREIRGELGMTLVPIVGVTAEAFTDRHVELIDAGMNGILTKPFTEEQLSRAIVAAAGRGILKEATGDDGPPPSAMPPPPPAPAETAQDSGSAEAALRLRERHPVGDDKRIGVFLAGLKPETRSSLLVKAEQGLISRVEQLRHGLAESDPESIRQAAHAMKGACGSMFAPQISELAAAVERNAKDIDAVHEMMPAVETAADNTVAWWRGQLPS